MIDKEQIKKEIDNNGQVIISYDKDWRWFHNRDDQNTCPLLKFMIDIEYRSGTLIFIPDKENQSKMVDRNKG